MLALYKNMKTKNIIALILKDWKVEMRQKHAIAGILLFVVTTVFIIYKSFNDIGPQTWNILLWLVVLFGGINAIVKSFVQEKSDTYLYYYTLVSPLEHLLAKLIYNILLLFCLVLIIIGTMTIFSGNPVKDWSLFIQATSLGTIGIGIIFTFVSSISGSAGQNTTMMSVLSLPLVLPVVLTLIKVTSVAMRLMQDSTVGKDLLILAGIDALLFGMVLFLYPMVWKG